MADYFRANENLDSPAVVGRDQDTFAEFYMNPETNKPFCRKVFPGDKTKTWDQPVREVDKRQYPQAWANFEQGLERFHGQTLLESWPVLNEGTRSHLKANQIFTVEQIAEIGDHLLDGLGPNSLELRNKAQAFVAEKKKAEEWQPMKNEVAELRRQIAQMQAVQADAPKRRGRPPKNKEEVA